MQVHTKFSELEWLLSREDSKERLSDEFLGIVRVKVLKFKTLMNETFDAD